MARPGFIARLLVAWTMVGAENNPVAIPSCDWCTHSQRQAPDLQQSGECAVTGVFSTRADCPGDEAVSASRWHGGTQLTC